MIGLISISATNVYAQTLYVDASVGEMDDIDESKYRATGISVVRDENGGLMSVFRVDATRYLDDPIIDEFLNSDPEMLIKTGSAKDQNISWYRTMIEHHQPKCTEEEYDVEGYNDLCDGYQRGFVTMFNIKNSNTEEHHIIFRGLNHAHVYKPLYSITTIWDIITRD